MARADTLRIGFALDSARRLTFVLAADGVTLGSHEYATLDLTSPDAVMDAAGNTVGDIANQLLAGLGDALGVVRQLLGLDAPAGVTPITLTALMANPVGAVSGYWQQVVAVPPRPRRSSMRCAARSPTRVRRLPQCRATVRRTSRGDCR